MRADLFALAALATAFAPQADAAAPPCDRACLQGVVDQTLAAMVAHDPKQAPLAANVRYTENGQTLPIGEGLWATASGPGSYRFYIADPEAGQVGLLGTLRETGDPIHVALRLKVVNRRITEAEAILSREGLGGDAGPGVKAMEALPDPDPVFLETVPPAQRLSRQRLKVIADLYFEAMERGHARDTPFDDACHRIENGGAATNVKTAPPRPDGSPGIQSLGCAAQFNTGFSKDWSYVPMRRYPVVDVERGLVFSVVALQHDGRRALKAFQAGKPETGRYAKPFQWTIAEVFKIKDGKIRRIEAILFSAPYGMPSGWETGTFKRVGTAKALAGDD